MMTAMRFFLFLGLLIGAVPIAAQVSAPESPATQESADSEAVSSAEVVLDTITAAQAEEEAEHSAQMIEMELNHRSRSIVQFGTDVRLLPGDTVGEVVVIGGSLVVEGRVIRNVVVVGGNVELGENATVGGDLVNVLGTTTIAQGASIGRELVVVGGRLEAPFQFRAGRSQNVISLPGGLQAFVSGIFPWVTGGLMWGRVVVPGLPWMWGIIGIVSLVYLSIGFLFSGAVARVGAPIEERPLSTFLAGLATLIVAPLIIFLLGVSVVGIIVIPFFVAALLMAGLIGRVAVARRLGGGVLPELEPENRMRVLGTLLIGMAILLVAYMVPLLGIIVWMFVGVFGLGGAALAALSSLGKEIPRRTRPPVPPAPTGGETGGAPYASGPVSPPPIPGGASFSDLGAQGFTATGGPSPEPISAHVPFPPTSLPAGGLLAFPRATFLERLGAFALDAALLFSLLIVLQPLRRDFGLFVVFVLVYFIGFWAWKGATIGGTILQLRVVQSHGRFPNFGEAIVRGFTGVFSLAVVGLGGLWILWDPERQGWHDRIAGTYVVKVPRDYPF